MEWEGGNVYEGEWELGKRKGKGKFTWSNGKVQEGTFGKNQLMSGQGTEEWPDGRKYSGEFKEGKAHGKGT